MLIDVPRHNACSVCTWSLTKAEEWDQVCLTTGICFSTTDISTTSFQRQQCAGCYSQYCFSQTHSSTASYSNKAQFLIVGLLPGCTCQQGVLLSKRSLFSIGFYCHLKQQVVLIAADLSTSSNFFFRVCLLPITPNQPNCTPAWDLPPFWALQSKQPLLPVLPLMIPL